MAKTEEAKGTEYVVLRLDEEGAWAPYGEHVKASSGPAAMRAAAKAIGEADHGAQPTLVALPARSWQPQTFATSATIDVKAV